MLTGFSGGFFFAGNAATEKKRIKQRERRTLRTCNRSVMARILSCVDVLTSITGLRNVATAGCLGRRRSRGRRKARLGIRFARGRRRLQFAYLRSPDISVPQRVNRRA